MLLVNELHPELRWRAVPARVPGLLTARLGAGVGGEGGRPQAGGPGLGQALFLCPRFTWNFRKPGTATLAIFLPLR